MNIRPKILCLLPDDLNEKKILDVGIGYGKWGYILRTWKQGNPYIVGIDPYSLYIENVKRVQIYNEVYCMTAQQYLTEKPNARYDIILFCEVIEHHLTKEEAWATLEQLETRLNPGGILILSTPDGHSRGAAMCDGNELNDHPIGFHASEFEKRGYETTRILKEIFMLGHVIGPLAYVWFTLRWGKPPATHTVVAWKRRSIN